MTKKADYPVFIKNGIQYIVKEDSIECFTSTVTDAPFDTLTKGTTESGKVVYSSSYASEFFSNMVKQRDKGDIDKS